MNRAERRRLEKLGKKAGPPEALLHDAAAHHRAGSLAEAESRYRAFLALTPGHAQATHLLGLVCHQLGRNREAADLIADAERRAPADPEIPFNLGNCLKYVARADHKGKPIEDLEKALWYLQRELARRKA